MREGFEIPRVHGKVCRSEDSETSRERTLFPSLDDGPSG